MVQQGASQGTLDTAVKAADADRPVEFDPATAIGHLVCHDRALYPGCMSRYEAFLAQRDASHRSVYGAHTPVQAYYSQN